MKSKNLLLLSIFLALNGLNGYAQNIGINNTGAAAVSSAMLDINAPNKGLLIPRLTDAQRNAIASPAAGLFIYDTSVNKVEYWNGTSWVQLSNNTVSATNATGSSTGRGISISSSPTPADPSAMLDIQSSTGGLLIPRMSGTQRDNIQSPVAGLIIYNTTTQLPNFYSSTGWQQLCGSSVSTATGATTTPANVGINTSTPNPSAMLDVTSVTAGLAMPRLTGAQRDAILSPAQGLMLFNLTTQSINVYDGSSNWLDFVVQTIPSAPAAGTDTPSQTQITWNWNSVTGANGYKYNTTNNYNTAADNGTSTSYTQTGLICNKTDTLYVWSYNCAGNSLSAVLAQATAACSVGCGSLTSITDSRDGQVYNIVQIGTQCWMAQNLNYGAYAPVGVNQAAGTKNCQNSSGVNDSTCPYGGLYQWLDLMNGSTGCNGVCTGTDNLCDGPGNHQACDTPVQGLCPAGWHIPTTYEWTELESNAGTPPENVFPYDVTTVNVTLGSTESCNLKSETGWPTPCSNFCGGNGMCNSTGFSALPAGITNGGSFTQGPNAGAETHWWTCTGSGGGAWTRLLFDGGGGVRRVTPSIYYGFSVRCVKD